jgi:hypothetical protein
MRGHFLDFIPTYITKEEINKFVNDYIGDYLDEEEPNLLECDGKLKALRELEKTRPKKVIKIADIENMEVLKEGTELLDKSGKVLGTVSFRHYYPKNQIGFNTDKGFVYKRDIAELHI